LSQLYREGTVRSAFAEYDSTTGVLKLNVQRTPVIERIYIRNPLWRSRESGNYKVDLDSSLRRNDNMDNSVKCGDLTARNESTECALQRADVVNGSLNSKSHTPNPKRAEVRTQNIFLQGNFIFPDSVLSVSFKDFTGKRLDFDLINYASEQILRLYRKHGYAAAGFEQLTFDTSKGVMTIIIDEGRLKCIDFKGLTKVPLRALAREIPLRSGDIITRKAILKGVANLYATGLFRSVFPTLQPDPTDSGWHIVFHVQEHPSPPVRLGLSYLSQHRTRGFAELTLSSPFSYAERMVLFTSVGEMDYKHHISFLIDKVYGFPFTFNLSLNYRNRKRYEFDKNHYRLGKYSETRWGGMLETGGQAMSWGLLAFTARWEEHRNEYLNSENRYQMTALGVKLALDNLDRYPYPNQGLKLDALLESSGDYLASDVNFTRFGGSLESYITFKRRYTIGLRLLGRTADRTTPRDENFRLGGIHEFPGLNLDEEVGIIQIAGGLDLRFDLLSRLFADTYIGARFDVGGSWDDPAARIERESLMPSFVFYIAFDTFLGPLHLQWGRLMDNGDICAQNIIFIQAGNVF